MSTYILVHGAWHGAWCWDKVVSLLKSKGHNVEAIDLPGSGQDTTPINEVTLDSCAQKVCEVLDTQMEPVILVGHSLGGITISQAAERRPDKVKILVYLTAFLLKNGQSRFSLSGLDTESLTSPNVVVSENKSYSIFKQEALKEVLYADCQDDDIARAKSHLRPQALAPCGTPLRLTEENFGRIPRVYIECLYDKAISLNMQKRMYTAMPCQRVLTLKTGHSPFLSEPEALTAQLVSIGKLKTA